MEITIVPGKEGDDEFNANKEKLIKIIYYWKNAN